MIEVSKEERDRNSSRKQFYDWMRWLQKFSYFSYIVGTVPNECSEAVPFLALRVVPVDLGEKERAVCSELQDSTEEVGIRRIWRADVEVAPIPSTWVCTPAKFVSLLVKLGAETRGGEDCFFLMEILDLASELRDSFDDLNKMHFIETLEETWYNPNEN